MSQIIKIKRGTFSQLLAFGPLKEAEMGFCTDTKEVFIGDGKTNSFVGKAMCGAFDTMPKAKVEGRFYFVTSGTNVGNLYMDDGAAWHQVNMLSLAELKGDLDNVKDGTTYGKVKKEDIKDGHVTTLVDGSNIVTAESLKSHIDDFTKHPRLNDTIVESLSLWSSYKISSEFEKLKRHSEYQASVKKKGMKTPPDKNLTGDRYLVVNDVTTSDASNQWFGHNNHIAEWTGTAWRYYIPEVGFTCYVDDEEKHYSWNGTDWIRTGGALQTIEAGKGLNGGGQSDTVSLSIGAGDGITVGDHDISVKAAQGITVDSNGVMANIDGNSIQYDAANGNKLTVINIDGGTF